MAKFTKGKIHDKLKEKHHHVIKHLSPISTNQFQKFQEAH